MNLIFTYIKAINNFQIIDIERISKDDQPHWIVKGKKIVNIRWHLNRKSRIMYLSRFIYIITMIINWNEPKNLPFFF